VILYTFRQTQEFAVASEKALSSTALVMAWEEVGLTFCGV
jgi:hypothetical protein